MSPPGATVVDLAAEQTQLQDFVRALDPGRVAHVRRRRGCGTCATRSATSPTPTRWRSTRSPADRTRSTRSRRARASDDDVTYQGVHARPAARGRGGARLVGAHLGTRARRARGARSERACRRGASACAPPSLVTARLMETWAHGLDVHAALARRAGRHRPARARRVARDARARRTRSRSPAASRRPSRCGSSSRCRRARRGPSVRTTPPTASPDRRASTAACSCSGWPSPTPPTCTRRRRRRRRVDVARHISELGLRSGR